MKAFTIAAAIEKGLPLTYHINSPQSIDLSNVKWPTCTGTTSPGDNYHPSNSTPKQGDLTMIEAARASTNTYFLQLSGQVGLCPIAKLAASMGMNDAQTGGPLAQVVSMTLGVDTVTPLMLANAYATFANRGKYCTPLLISSITSKDGKAIKTPGPSCKQVMPAEVADGVNYVLQQVMEPGGTGATLKFGSTDLAGKTGTTTSTKAVWYAGYSTKLAAAAVVAIADPELSNRGLIGRTFDGRKMDDASGSGTAGPLWKTAMQNALKGVPNTRFTAPTDETKRGNVEDLPRVNGMNPDEAANKLRSMGFQAQIAPGQVDSEETAGTVAYTSPRTSEGAPEGSMVTVYVSNGSKGNQPPNPPNSPGTPPNPPNPPNTGKPGGGGPNIPCPTWHPQYPNCGGR
jgi:membrane peptidoglycan carboxypeptidase